MLSRVIIPLCICSFTLFMGCQKTGAAVTDEQPAEPVETQVVEQSMEPAMEESGESDTPGAEQEEAPVEEAPPVVGTVHDTFDGLLKTHVSAESGMVDYDGLKSNEAQLDAYLQEVIAAANIADLSEDEQFAFYINAYNAYTIKLILERYPKLKSITDYKEPWKQKRWNVAGETLSLDQIEHEKLRPVFKDPRIHFAVNCASVGCPPLRAEAYVASTLEQQLEAATKQTLTQTKYVEVKKGKLYLTKILEWYGKDFVNPEFKGHAESVAQYVARYASDDVVELVNAKGAKTPVRYKSYDWNLNKQ